MLKGKEKDGDAGVGCLRSPGIATPPFPLASPPAGQGWRTGAARSAPRPYARRMPSFLYTTQGARVGGAARTAMRKNAPANRTVCPRPYLRGSRPGERQRLPGCVERRLGASLALDNLQTSVPGLRLTHPLLPPGRRSAKRSPSVRGAAARATAAAAGARARAAHKKSMRAAAWQPHAHAQSCQAQDTAPVSTGAVR